MTRLREAAGAEGDFSTAMVTISDPRIPKRMPSSRGKMS